MVAVFAAMMSSTGAAYNGISVREPRQMAIYSFFVEDGAILVG